MDQKKPIRIYEVYEGVAKPSNLYVDPETKMVVVIKDKNKEPNDSTKEDAPK